MFHSLKRKWTLMLVIVKLLLEDLLSAFCPDGKVCLFIYPSHKTHSMPLIRLLVCPVLFPNPWNVFADGCFGIANSTHGAGALHIDVRSCDVFPILLCPFPNNLEHSIPFSDLYRAPCSRSHGAPCVAYSNPSVSVGSEPATAYIDLRLHLCTM